MVPRITILLFTVILLELSVDGQKAKGKKDPESNELLVAVLQAVQNNVELIGQQNKAISDIMISFNDAKAEMEKVQRSMEDNNKELDTKLSQQMEELSTKFFEQLAVMNDKLTDSDDVTNTKLDNTSAKIEDLASKLKESKDENEELRKTLAIFENTTTLLIANVANTTTLLIADVANTTTLLIADVASNVTSDLTSKISDVASSATSEIKDLTSKISDVESVAGKWPSGSYCIFRKGGSCPSGFTSYSGYAKHLYQYYPSGYMSAVTFGDSSLGCAGSCNSGGANVYDTNLIINSCCK